MPRPSRGAVPNIHLARNNTGVTEMPLIGGRYDGGTWTAVIGCPVCIPVKPPKAQKDEDRSGRFVMAFWGNTGPQEGDEWKSESTKDAPENRAKRFALYAPRIENGKASLALYFVEEIDRA